MPVQMTKASLQSHCRFGSRLVNTMVSVAPAAGSPVQQVAATPNEVAGSQISTRSPPQQVPRVKPTNR